jgi:hypothetical protein
LEQRTKILKARAAQEDGDVEESTGQDKEDFIESAATSLVPPSPLQLAAIGAPYNLTATQIETIQLVAQLTAMDGKW